MYELQNSGRDREGFVYNIDEGGSKNEREGAAVRWDVRCIVMSLDFTADHLYEFAKALIAEIEIAVLEVTLSQTTLS
jgi:hypothetical protein